MCGIIGIASPKAREKRDLLEKTLPFISHRGPDAQDLLAFDKAVLGHTRLSIVDIACGAQPMEDAKTAVTFNGEIYGFEDIKKTLTDYPFTTNSDTEVILALYQKYGENFVTKLPGMFAFALWDKEKETLICARDRFGEKPFYYATTDKGEFIFASELKAIIASGFIKPIIDSSSLSHYFSYLYIHPHTTVYKNIHVLPPAHQLVFKNGKVEVKRYWDLPKINDSISTKEAVAEFRRLLDKSVKNQLVADVPVGAFLSGGLDSSTIVALASKYKKNLKTFSFEFGKGKSEAAFAREVARKYGTEHIELKDTDYKIADLIHEMANVYDEPFADSSNIPTYAMSKAARKYAKVILTGDGGDEMCGGYSGWYQPLLAFSQKSGALKFLRFFGFPAYKLRNIERGEALRGKYLTVLEAHESQQQYFTKDELRELGFNQDFYKRNFLSGERRGTVDDAIRADIEDYMPGDILTKIDRASMAHGLELRAPFLDIEFAEFCISLPHRLKISTWNDKIILRKAFQYLWPDSIKKRSKQGFGAPVHEWLKDPAVQELKKIYLGNPKMKIFEVISFDKSQKYIAKDDYKTWILLTLSLWLEKHKYEIQ